MNLDELRSALDTERQKGGLQGLRDSFYQEVAEFVEELKAERDALAAEADDPFGSPEVQRLTNDIETARSTAESLYERRLGKLVKQASLAAADMASPDQVEGLTDEERALYDDLVDRIEGNKDHMFDVIAGEAATTPAVGRDDPPTPHPEDGMDASTAEPAPEPSAPDRGTDDAAADSTPRPSADGATPDGTASPPTENGDDDASDPVDRAGDVAAAEASAVAGDGDDGVSAAEVMGEQPSAGDPATDGSGVATQSDGSPPEPTPGGEPAAAGSDTDGGPASDAATTDVDRTTVRITDEVGEIFGVDQREYRLDADDVVTLPTANAEPLLDREAAEKLD